MHIVKNHSSIQSLDKNVVVRSVGRVYGIGHIKNILRNIISDIMRQGNDFFKTEDSYIKTME